MTVGDAGVLSVLGGPRALCRRAPEPPTAPASVASAAALVPGIPVRCDTVNTTPSGGWAEQPQDVLNYIIVIHIEMLMECGWTRWIGDGASRPRLRPHAASTIECGRRVRQSSAAVDGGPEGGRGTRPERSEVSWIAGASGTVLGVSRARPGPLPTDSRRAPGQPPTPSARLRRAVAPAAGRPVGRSPRRAAGPVGQPDPGGRRVLSGGRFRRVANGRSRRVAGAHAPRER
jgi:hypothetical protein